MLLKNLYAVSLFVFASLAFAEQAAYKIETVYEGLDLPWGMTFVGDDKALITQKEGSLVLLDLKTGVKQNVSGLPSDIYTKRQGGLLDVKQASNGWLYFTYVKSNKDGHGATTLARAKLSSDKLTSWQDLLITDSVTDTGRHFGSRIVFADADTLFFGVGDRAKRSPAQDLSNHMGTLLRVDMQGRAKDDNPFVADKSIRAEIWSYGHRNPQGLAIDALGQLWEIEHGPRGGDEINKITPKANYGWPVISFGKEYSSDKAVGEATHKKGMEQPEAYFVPSIAPSSLMIYSGRAFPQWQGNFFAGALALTHLNRLALNPDGKLVEQERLLDDLQERIRYVCEDRDGLIYLLTDTGKLMRISPQV